jgi:lipoprotein-anchoring transpeptidase ErfK/SrfK
VADTTPGYSRRHISSEAERRRRDSRHKRYWRRRFTALLLVVAVALGVYFGGNWLLGRLFPSETAGEVNQPEPVVAKLTFETDSFLPLGDLDADGTPEQIAVGKAEGTSRSVALVTGSGRNLKQIGTPVKTEAYALKVGDLPRQRGLLILSGMLSSPGESTSVAIPGGKALQAAGGEPFFRAWRPDMRSGLVPVEYYELAAPLSPPAPTAVVVDKYLNALWFFKDGQLVQTHRVATGKFLDGPLPTAANQAVNFLTPVGTFAITYLNKNPYYYKDKLAGGDPKNPLGTRFMGFSVYEGDKAAIWAIHGTNEPDSIGHWVSDGCIRLPNPAVEQLFDQVPAGTPLQILDSRPRS